MFCNGIHESKSSEVAESNADVARIFDLLERKFWLPEKSPGAIIFLHFDMFFTTFW